MLMGLSKIGCWQALQKYDEKQMFGQMVYVMYCEQTGGFYKSILPICIALFFITFLIQDFSKLDTEINLQVK